MATDSLKPIPIREGEAINLKTAAALANSSPDTVVRWAKRYGIGAQLGKGERWQISKPALRMVVAVDVIALEAFQQGDRSHPAVVPYLLREGQAA